MEKLSNHFKQLSMSYVASEALDPIPPPYPIYTILAITSMKIAIDFAIYCDSNGWSFPIIKNGTIKAMEYDSNETIDSGELFERFIKQYGKI